MYPVLGDNGGGKSEFLLAYLSSKGTVANNLL
jgi:hypothetical protein